MTAGNMDELSSSKAWATLQARAALRGLQLRRDQHGITVTDLQGRVRRIATVEQLEDLVAQLSAAAAAGRAAALAAPPTPTESAIQRALRAIDRLNGSEAEFGPEAAAAGVFAIAKAKATSK